MQGDKAGADFVVRNDIGALVGASSIHIISVSIPETEIYERLFVG